MVKIISKKHIYEFMDINPQFAEGLRAWLTIVEDCTWGKPQDIVITFGPKAIDILGKKDNKPTTISSNRVVFDIKGNHLRIIAKYQFYKMLKKCQLYLKWIGTHAEYDKLCKENLQFEIDMFKQKSRPWE